MSSTTADAAASSAGGSGETSGGADSDIGEHEECPAWLLTLLSSTNILDGALNSVARATSKASGDTRDEELLVSLVLQRKRPAWSRAADDSSDAESEKYEDLSSSDEESDTEHEDEGSHGERPVWRTSTEVPQKRGRPRSAGLKLCSSPETYSPLAYRPGVPPSLHVKVDDSFACALNSLADAVAAEVPSNVGVRCQLLKLCCQLANSMTRTYQLIAGDGAPIMRLRSAKGVGSKCGEGGNGKTASTRSRFISKAAAGRLKAAAQNLRECFDDTDSSSLRRQAMETNTILEFPENSRAKRRFTEQGQGGSGSVFGSRGQGQLKVAEDCPEDIKPALDVVRACLRSDPDPQHDLRFAVDTPIVRDENSGLFGEYDVIANRDVHPGEMGPYSGTVLRDDEVLRHLAKKPRVFLRAMHFW